MGKGIFIFGLIIFLGCNKKDSLNGHWHSYSAERSAYETLDIKDTVTIVNNYSLSGSDRIEFPRIDDKGRYILPLNSYSYSKLFDLSNDTLTIRDSSAQFKYIRSNISDCIVKDRYRNSSISIRLNEVDKAEVFDKSQNLCSVNLLIGKVTKGNRYSDSLSVVFSDSIFIEANRVWIGLKDITQLCQDLSGNCFGDKSICFNFHADREVPYDFLKRIENTVPFNIKINKVVRIRDQDIGLEKLR